MDNEYTAEESGGVMERHAQTIISIIIAALLLWAGASLSDLREIVARQDERMVTMQRGMDSFREIRNEVWLNRDRLTTLEAQFKQLK